MLRGDLGFEGLRKRGRENRKIGEMKRREGEIVKGLILVMMGRGEGGGRRRKEGLGKWRR